MPRFDWGAATDVGRLRTANEDAYSADETLFVVADGMGGHLAGEVASAMAVDALRARLGTPVTADLDALVGAVDTANRQIFQASHTRVDQHGMGTTITAIAPVRGDGGLQLGLVNVGDSRAYAVRQGRLAQLSVDHSYVQELVATGQITATEARGHPHRNIVTRALGIEPVVRIDAWTMSLIAGDRFILCSDGLVDEVLDSVIAEIATGVADPQEAAERLVEAANRNGGRDNITVVVVDVLEGAESDTAELELAPHGDGTAGDPSRWADNHSHGGTSPAVTGAGANLRIVPAETGDDRPVGDNGTPGDLGPEYDDITRSLPRPRAATRSLAGPTGLPTPGADGDGIPPLAGEPDEPRRGGPGMHGRLGLGTIAFLTAVAAVFVVGFVMIAAYARSGYFVAYRGEEIVVYKGRPDGVLWFDPTVAAIARQKRSDLPASDAQAIENRPEFDSLDAAVGYIDAHSVTAPGISVVASTPATTNVAPTLVTADPAVTTTLAVATAAPVTNPSPTPGSTSP